MFFKCFGAVVALTMMAAAVTGADDADATAKDVTAAEPSAYSAAYLPPKFGALQQHNPYEGAVASTLTDIVRTPGHHGQVAAYHHKTVETPFSSAHVRSDVRFTNDAQPYPNRLSSAYPYAASAPAYPYAASAPTYPYAAVPATAYPYAAAVPAPAYPYAAAAVPAPGYPYAAVPAPAYPYAATAAGGAYPYKALPLAAVPYGYGPAVAQPHSVAHASFSGPYGAHYSYKR